MVSINRRVNGEKIGELNNWALFIITDKSTEQWTNLRLVHMTAKRRSIPKRTFRFGWNGHRFSENPDIKILTQAYPHLRDWVVDCVRAAN